MTSVDSMTTRFALLPPDRPADDLEREMLGRWREEGLFARTLAVAEGRPEFVFHEGPPTANGRPGIHHVFSRTLKDLICRHRAMRGFHVTRKAGWDTHGLPVEIEVEKQLGISGKQQIEAIGIERFNQLCRESVFTYRADWERLSERMAYWLDYEHPYVTYTPDYIESVWWALKTLFDRDLLYRGHKILPYCPRCGTSLSSHEVAQGYKDVHDPSVTIALDLTETGGEAVPTVLVDGRPRALRRILVWTTTPWTLVSNAALAVNPELEYVELRKRGSPDARTVIVASARAGAVLGEDYDDRWETVTRLRGDDLVGARYRRPFDFVELGPGVSEVVVGERFVSAADGSGVVHLAPAFGADDYAAGQRHGLSFVQPVDARGEFPPGMPVAGGTFVKRADPLLVEELKRRGYLWKAGTLEHSYPHCWRCDTPLLYYARTSWFIRTTAYRDQMLARNARVNWTPPEVGERRFGEWLVNNIDWAISRERYWGTPLPLWMCDAEATHLDAIGSYADLAAKSGTALPPEFDPHKPHVDGYAWPCTRCTGTMRRVPEVIDTWFDSGSMPFAQWHYPFENRELTARHYPADYIAEGIDQTRGWFYSLLAIATGLGDALPNNARARDGSHPAAPYAAVVVNDLVLDAEGQKMSKRKGNIVDPWAVFAAHGADATRLFLVSSAQVWMPRRFDEVAIRESAGRFLLTLKNVYSGIFATYANFGWTPSELDPPPARRPVLDRWILARLATVEQATDAALQRFDATSAARAVLEFFDDDVSKWYVRLSRSRFYDVESEDNRAAFATLYEVLVVVNRLLAPFAPFISDWMHRELTGTSVHLAPFTRGDDRATVERELEPAMAAIRALATLGRAAREEAGIKVRQPLSRLVCVVPDVAESSIRPLVPLLEAELNVKRVEFASSADALVSLEAKPNFRALGRKFGKETPLAASAVAAFDGEALRAFERGEPLVVSVGGQSHQLDADDVTIRRRASGALVVQEHAGHFVALDPTITPALREEGIVREVISQVQRMRKGAGLAVSDRIVLALSGNEEVERAVEGLRERLASEVLAREVATGRDATAKSHDTTQTMELDGLTIRVGLSRVE